MDPIRNSITDFDLQLLKQCRTENQRLETIFTGYEQEIDQLMVLLTDVLEQYNYHSLRHRAIDYFVDLKHLKIRLARLRMDLICASGQCGQSSPCKEPRLGLFQSIKPQLTALTNEFLSIKEGCYQFLSVMVQLNLM